MLQGILYSTTLILVVLFPILAIIYWQITGRPSQVIITFLGIVNPLQGFFNFLVYLMPVFQRSIAQRKKRKREVERNRILQNKTRGDQSDIVCESTDDVLYIHELHLFDSEEEKEEISPIVFEIHGIHQMTSE